MLIYLKVKNNQLRATVKSSFFFEIKIFTYLLKSLKNSFQQIEQSYSNAVVMLNQCFSIKIR